MVTRNAKICQNCFHRRRQSTILGPRSNAEKTSETTFRSRDTAAWGLRAQKLMIPSKNSRVPEIISSQKRCFGLANPSQRARQRHPFGPGSRGTLSTAEDNGSTLHHSKMLLISVNQYHKPDQRANQEAKKKQTVRYIYQKSKLQLCAPKTQISHTQFTHSFGYCL